MRIRKPGTLGAMGAALAAALGSAIGCGDSFGGDDCHESRTCAVAGNKGSAGSPDDAGGAGGSDSTTGGDAASAGAAGGIAGAGGADGACHLDVDCSNHDPADGEETCEKGECLPGNQPPRVVSFTPESDAVDVEPDTTIVIEFSEPLDPKTVTSTSVSVLDGATAVPGKLEYSEGKVTFTPDAPLALLAPYTLSVTSEVKDEAGAPLLEELSSTFYIRDGAWHEAIDVAKDTHGVLSDVLPMRADGSALVVWSGSVSSYCPAWARWFLRGESSMATKSLAIAGQTECNLVTAGGNAAGVGAVAWSEPDASNGTDVAQFRDGAWLAKPALVSKEASADRLRLAVSPSGVVTFFEHNTGASKAWVTNADGSWPASGKLLSAFTGQGRTSVAFDAQGDGLAVWRAKDPLSTKLQRIVAARFSSASGSWEPAIDLVGSVTTTSADAQRGTPVVATDDQGDALALWVDATFAGKLMASRYLQATGWAEPEVISGAPVVDLLEDAPALTFDGEAYVAAWTGLSAGKRYTYTARYDLDTGWGTYQKQQTAVDGTSAARMPRLVSDGRGNLLLVFAKGATPTFTLMTQRYSAGAWGAITAVPGATVERSDFENADILPLSMSANGLATLAWTNYNSVDYVSTVRLASFF